MEQRIDAIFEDGVFKPLAPLSFANRERVSLTIRSSMIDEEDWVDRDFLAEAEAEGDDSVSLEQVRHALAKIQGGLTESFREERDQR